MAAHRLAEETSPYLRQHADNPVDWYPWGEEAFERARTEDKPIFLSIGYASCHWCHVMAHESFEDEATAGVLRDSFVSIKIDREERPDIDALYMSAVQALTGSGGWPMSVFATPDGRPFFAGTYFPPEERHGMPAFTTVLEAVSEAWRERRSEVEAQADALRDAVAADVQVVDRLALKEASADAAPLAFSQLVERVVGEMAPRFDPRWGGFGPAPKFPRPSLVELCLLHHRRTGDPHSLEMATRTLDAMAAGGLYDHLVGGFCRYSTDAQWTAPHFEKMLTDQALLARTYLHAWQLTGNEDYLVVVSETLDYVVRDLGAPGGGLYSSQDADAAGHEGGHATFSSQEVHEILEQAGLGHLEPAVRDWYGVSERGNWEGTNIFRRPVGAPLRRPPEIEAARRALADARTLRTQPATDDKVLTEWSAMMAAALAEAAAATGTAAWATAAEGVVTFLFSALRRDDGRFLRSYQGGRARHLAYAGDYAWLLESCTRLAELTGRQLWLERAREVADALVDLFWDTESGGFFTTGRDAEQLLVRAKDVVDGALPSTNASAASALFRLGALRGEHRYREVAEAIVALGAPLLRAQPSAVPDLVVAVGFEEETAEIVVVGDRLDLLAAVRAHWLPTAVLAWGEPGDSDLWTGRKAGFAYVCRGFQCDAPTDGLGTLAGQLDQLERAPAPGVESPRS